MTKQLSLIQLRNAVVKLWPNESVSVTNNVWQHYTPMPQYNKTSEFSICVFKGQLIETRISAKTANLALEKFKLFLKERVVVAID